MPSQVTPRRLAVGLLLGLALGVGAGWGWLVLTSAEQARAQERREARVLAQQLAELVAEAGLEEAGPIVDLFAELHPSAATARVVDLDERRLVASTAPADVGDRAAPRRLVFEEKELYDRGQQLRTAVETNLSGEGAARKDLVIASPPRARGGLDLARRALVARRRRRGVGASCWRWSSDRRRRRRAGRTRWWRGSRSRRSRALGALPRSFGCWVLTLGGPLVLATSCWPPCSRARSAVLGSWRRRISRASTRCPHGRAGGQQRSIGGGAGVDPSTRCIEGWGEPSGRTSTPGAWDDDAELARPHQGASIAAVPAGVRRLAINLLAMAIAALAVLLGVGGARTRRARLRRHRVAPLLRRTGADRDDPAGLLALSLRHHPVVHQQNIYNGRQAADRDLGGARRTTSRSSETSTWCRETFRTGADQLSELLLDAFLHHRLDGRPTWPSASRVGLTLALMFNTRGLALKPVYRVLLILPWAVPNYITALIWSGMFHQQFGVVNQLVQIFGGEPIAWFDRPLTVVPRRAWPRTAG
jgi:arabinogalactan oligomer / maltooligosaccharide transport system permease protein